MSPSRGGFGSASESEDENTEGAVCSPRGFRTSFFLRFGGGEAIVIEEMEKAVENAPCQLTTAWVDPTSGGGKKIEDPYYSEI